MAERANRTIVEMARSMIHSQGLGREFWAEAECNAAYTRNWCPTRVVYGMTPKEAWSGKKPSISHLREFGCIAYAKVPDEKRSKLDAKGIKCLMLGYCEGTRAYRLMCLETKKIIKSPDVTFFEDMEDLEKCPSARNEGSDHMVDSFPKSNQKEGIVDDLEDDEEQEEDLGDGEKKVEAPSAPSGSLKASKAKEVAPKPPQPTPSTQEEDQTLQESRYPSRVRKPLGEWWKNNILPDLAPNVEERANVAFTDEPQTMSEAVRGVDASKWEAAMQEVYESLMGKGTWELAALPKDRKSVGSKWVFCTKRDALGQVVCYKARQVAKGYSQVEGVDFNETFAPVAKFTTIRYLLAIGAALDLEMHQMDVKTAFLKPYLEEVIYIEECLVAHISLLTYKQLTSYILCMF